VKAVVVVAADRPFVMSDRQPLVIFTPSGRQGRVDAGISVLDAARQLGADLDTVCGGRGRCGRCQIDVSEGEFPKHGIASSASHLGGTTEVETAYATRKTLNKGRRLGCQALIQGDVVIDVPPESQVHRQVVRKRAEAHVIEIDPVLRLHTVEVAEPDMDVPGSDVGRLVEALAAQWDLSSVEVAPAALAEAQAALRQGRWTVTAAVRDGQRVVGVRPGFAERAFGLAIDVGSTTMACHLIDLADGSVLATVGQMNPQIKFGEDLMSRVSYAMMHDGGAAEMTAVVRGALDELAGAALDQAGLDRADVYEVVIVGNPIMHHLVLGLDPEPLGVAPFALAVDQAVEVDATALGFELATAAQVYLLPCIAGHVGADAAAMILAEAPYQRDEITLLVDVGTNAELVLGNRERLLAASSPTGPAFEGAQITHGQRAAPGAIERVRIDRKTLRPRFRVIGSDLWSDEEGFAAAIDKTGVTGICGSGIIEAVAELVLAGVVKPDGGFLDPDLREFTLYEAEQTVVVTLTDIRAIQLAKGALHAGARLLMDKLGVNQIDRIVLAGAFGSQIDPIYAMALGMIPDCDPEMVSSAGNAAGTGARIALLNRAARREIEDVVRRVEKIETAVEPAFQDYFIDAMAIPHAKDPYNHLAKVIDLPVRQAPEDAPKRRRGRNRRGTST